MQDIFDAKTQQGIEQKERERERGQEREGDRDSDKIGVSITSNEIVR